MKRISLLLVALVALFSTTAIAQTASIVVDVNTDMGSVNRNVLSSATARSTNMEGLWDLNNNRPVPEMVAYAQSIGMRYLRYQNLEVIDWKTAVGQGRTTQYGIPEFLQFCEASGAIPIIVISAKIQSSTPADVADLVEYLNALNNGSNPNGGIDWASVRAGDGHTDPWNVVWFEYGNESWAYMQANTYVKNYINYRNAVRQTMMSAYPTLTQQELNERIKLGAVLGNYFWDAPRGKWNAEVIPGTGSVADFYIIHTYIPAYTQTCCNEGDNVCLTTSLWAESGWFYPQVCTSSADNVFKSGLSGVNDQLENYLHQLNSFIDELTGRNIGIAVTEFNGHFVQHWYLPSAYRHSLGDALINAEFIRQFMHADDIAMSNFWQFANDYWGMVVGPNSFQGEANKPFGVRPNYYPFYLYHNYFGDTLIAVDTDVPSYNEEGFVEDNYLYSSFGVQPSDAETIQKELIDGNNLLNNAAWTISQPCEPANPDTYPVCEEEDQGILTVNFSGAQNIDYDDSQLQVNVVSDTRYRLSGLVKTNNLGDGEEAYLAVQTNSINLIADSSFEYTPADWPSDSNADWFFQPNSDSIGLSTYTDTSTSFSGSKSAYVNFSGAYDNNFYHVASATIDVDPNTSYALEGFIKTDSIDYQSSSLWNGIMIEVGDVAGCTRGEYYACWSLGQGLKGTNDWTRVSRNFTTTPVTTQIKVRLRRMSGGGNISGEAWWDNLKLSNKITTDTLSGTSDWRYVYVDFNTSDLNNPSTLAILASGNVRGDSIQNKYIQLKDVKLQKIIDNEVNGKTPYLSVNASKSTDGKKVYLMVVNKDMTNDISTTISTAGFIPANARGLTLNGPFVYSTNEINPNNVQLTEYDLGQVVNPVNYTFPAHSLTALVIYADTDGDGYSSEVDCNDDNAAINPGAVEVCDGIDNNCNDVIDEVPYYRDIDGDGYGNPADSVISCDAPAGYVVNNLDCLDNNVTVNPDAVEVCDDGLDNDCDGVEALCSPSGWYNGGGSGQWQFREAVSTVSGMTSVDLVNFPVLIKITDIEHPVFALAQADGDDIVFIDAQGVKLDHELEKFDPSTGNLVAWVSMPLLPANGAEIYMYYGNTTASNQENKEGVWDSNYVMVQHLSETFGQHFDSTAHDNDSSTVNVTSQGQTETAKIGGYDEFNGTNNYIIIPDSDSLDITGQITISAWINPNSWTKSIMGGIVNKLSTDTGRPGYRFHIDTNSNCVEGTNPSLATYYSTLGWGCSNDLLNKLSLNAWHQVSVTYDANNINFYVNSLPVGSIPLTSPPVNTANTRELVIGAWNVSGGNSFDGFLDEVRISNTARSAEWIAAEYNNQNNPDYIQFATSEVFCTDSDNDGYAAEGGVCGVIDCNDNNADAYPGGPPVRVTGTAINYYPALQAAYDASPDGSTIEGNTVNLTEDLYFNSDKTLMFTGGYDCGYLMVTGITTISGNVVISGGKVTIENLEIQ